MYQRPTESLNVPLPDGLDLDVHDNIATITLNRPSALNTLTFEMIDALTDLYDRVDRDPDVLVVLLTAAGTRAFCAGIDVKELKNADAQDRLAAMPMGGPRRNLFEVMTECAKPTVAAVTGLALGAGCELALASDIRILAADARMGLPEAKVGMGANFASHILPRLIPRGLAFEMLYTGRTIDADTAHTWGLANQLVDTDVRAKAENMCRTIASNAPLTVRRYKQVIAAGADLPLSAAMRIRGIPNPYTSADRTEGLDAMLTKRSPQWQAR